VHLHGAQGAPASRRPGVPASRRPAADADERRRGLEADFPEKVVEIVAVEKARRERKAKRGAEDEQGALAFEGEDGEES
jgi:hypothetical protein